MGLRALPRAAVAVAFAVLACSCASKSARPVSDLGDDAITVGSFNFPESVLLGEIYAQALEAGHLRVVLRLNLGTRELVDPALERGLVELVPEYSGSALTFLGGNPVADPATTTHLLEAAAAPVGLTALATSSAQDRNGFAMTSREAQKLGIMSLSDLVPHASSLVFGGPPECELRELCLRGLQDRYGLRFARFEALDAGGPLTTLALRHGTVDVALLFTSDPTFATEGFVVLADDLGLEPAESITPLIRSDTLARFGPVVARMLEAVSAALTTDALRGMNQAVAGGRPAALVAHDWLASRGILLQG